MPLLSCELMSAPLFINNFPIYKYPLSADIIRAVY